MNKESSNSEKVNQQFPNMDKFIKTNLEMFKKPNDILMQTPVIDKRLWNSNKEKSCNKLLIRLRKYRYTHNVASNYYGRMNIILILPAIIITGFSSIASFLSTSESVGDDLKQVFSILVGVLASISTMMQSFSSSLGYNTKQEMFRKAADEYDKLMVKTKFEILNPDEADFFAKIEQEIAKVQNSCKYLPPQWILDKWASKNNKHISVNNSSQTNYNSFDIDVNANNKNNTNTFNNLNNLANLDLFDNKKDNIQINISENNIAPNNTIPTSSNV